MDGRGRGPGGASLFCYALLTRALLPAEGRPKLIRLFGIDLAAAAVTHVIPAGTIGSAGPCPSWAGGAAERRRAYWRGSRTTDTKKSSICWTAVMN